MKTIESQQPQVEAQSGAAVSSIPLVMPEDSICYQDGEGRWRTLSALPSELAEAIAYIERGGGCVAMVNGRWHNEKGQR